MRLPRIVLPSLLLAAAALGVGNAQTVQIVSGNGQVASQFAISATPKSGFDPLVVKVIDVAGRPLPNATVNWAVTTGTGSVESSQTVTDANGQTSTRFFPFYTPINTTGFPYTQSVVTASTGASAAQFTETFELQNPQQAAAPNLVINFPVGTQITGQAGAVSSTPFAVQVTTAAGFPVQGVSVKLTTDDDPALGLPTVSCQTQAGQEPGVVLTDASGIANCYMVFGSKVGFDGTFKVNAGGGWRYSQSIPFVVTVGPPGSIRVLRGDNQAATLPGTNLPAPLVALVGDLGGNPVEGAAVTWTVEPASAATLFNTAQASSVSGEVSANVRMAAAAGPIRVRVALTSNPSISAVFNITAPAVTISGLNKASGDGQDAAQNTAFPNPIAVQAVSAGAPVAGVPVSFAVTSGSATLSASSAATNSQGIAQVNVNAGSNVGPVTVVATSGTYSVTFNLTVRPPGPAFNSDSFYNGFSYLKASDPQGGISPCSIARIAAAGVATGITGSVGPTGFGPLPYQINNTTVSFGDKRAPLFGISNTRGQEVITVQVPCDVTPGDVTVTISVQGSAKTGTVTVRPVSPGILEAVDPDNQTRAVLVRPDGSFVNAANNPARQGEIIRAYVTGLGPTLPIMSTNSIPVPGSDSIPTGNIIVGVNNAGARLVSVKAAANLIGIFEVAFEVPTGTPARDVTLSVAVDSAGAPTQFSKGSLIPVQ